MQVALSALEGVDRLEPHQRRALAFGQLHEMMQERIKDSSDYMSKVLSIVSAVMCLCA